MMVSRSFELQTIVILTGQLAPTHVVAETDIKKSVWHAKEIIGKEKDRKKKGKGGDKSQKTKMERAL